MRDTLKAIEIEDLRFAYPDGTEALSGVSFCVDEGECIGLIGPNGSGKTTVLLHLNGILRGQGRVRIYNRDVIEENLPFIRKEIGLVFQDPDMQLFMPTVFDDVAFGPVNLDWGPQEVRESVARALAEVDMRSYAQKISHHLSFGEKKRVSIATVLSMAPSILVLDEPTGNLDPKHRRQLIDILGGFAATKIIASHDLDMISRLADRVIYLEEGRVAAMGPTRQILGSIEKKAFSC